MTPDCVLRARRDVLWQVEDDGWLVYDPLARQSYRCGHAEHWLYQQLNGRDSLSEISRQWFTRPDHPGVSWPEMQAIARSLLTRGLVRSIDGSPVDNTARPRPTWLQRFSQSVSWRLRGVDPSSWLARVAPHCSVFFSFVAVRCWLAIALVVALLVCADFQRLWQQATLWQWLIKPSSGSTLFVLFLITRGIHELGHALVLTRLGGRCPDIGLIFMLGAPCVYCDVSESWRLQNWKQRAAVAAGGMYAELVVACCAGIVWLCTIPGTVNMLALQTMIVCSVSTWLVNANPLMRFDGYFILSDWLGEANLRARADDCSLQMFDSLLLGAEPKRLAHLSLTRKRFYFAFSLGGLIYRLSLSWMMASVIVALYTAWHFAWLGRLIALLLLACWWGIPAMKFVLHLWQAAQSITARMRLGLLTAGMVLVVCTVPLPYRIHSQGWIQPKRLQGLYAPATTSLVRVHKAAGERVQAGEMVVQLDNSQPRMRTIELKLSADRAHLQLATMRRQHRLGEELSVDLRALETTSRTGANQARLAEEMLGRYDLPAEISGRLISFNAPPHVDVDQHLVTSEPTLWLDPQQIGRRVPVGTLLAAVCSDQQIAVLPLTDQQLADVTVGTRVRLLFPSANDQLVNCEVSEIVQLNQIDSLSRLLDQTSPSPDGPSPDSSTQTRAAYAAIVSLPAELAFLSASAQAVFIAPPRTLATSINHWARHNLRWLVVAQASSL